MEYLSDGLTENIINNLSQTARLARHGLGHRSSLQGQDVTPSEVVALLMCERCSPAECFSWPSA